MTSHTDSRIHLADLLIASAAGDERAFTELHTLTHQYLHHVALRLLGTPSCAEEVLQEAYVSIWTQAHRFRPGPGSPMTWLIAIVRNQALSQLRSRRLEQQRVGAAAEAAWLDEVMEDDGENADPIRQAFYTTLRSRLPEAMAQLEPAQRQSIVLTFDHGMAHAEIAVHMNAPLGTVKSWLRRGMTRMHQCLVEGTPAPGRLPRSTAGARKPSAANHGADGCHTVARAAVSATI